MIAEFIAPQLGPVSEVIVLWLGQALIFGSLLAGMTWLIVRFLRRHLSPTMLMAFWALVLIKFLLPVGPSWSLSLASLCHPVAKAATGAPNELHTLSASLATNDATDDAGAQTAAATSPRGWQAPILTAYFLCVAGLAVLRIRAYTQLRRRCLALPSPDDLTTSLVHRVCHRLGIRPRLIVRTSTEHNAPFVMGLVRPILVISRRHLVRPDELETVVVHEVTHLRRGDMLVRCLQGIAGTVLFFWPVVLWVNRRIDEAREHVCDEGALRHGRLSPSEYATCLLQAAQSTPLRRFVYQPACMAGRPSTIERRIDMILASPSRPLRRRAWGLAVLTFLVAWGGFTLTGAADDGESKGAPGQTYDSTTEDFKRHADDLYAYVMTFDAGDLNSDGEVTKEECWAFVTTIAMQDAETFLKTYPAADFNQDGKLGLAEAYYFTRGDLELNGIAKEMDVQIKKAAKAGDKARVNELKAAQETRQIEAWHKVLDRRARIIADMPREPSRSRVKEISQKIAVVDKERGKKTKLTSAVMELRKIQEKAQTVRQMAEEAEGDEARKLTTAADRLDQKAKEFKLKVIALMKDEIAKLEKAGKADEAAKLKQKLISLKSE